MAGIAVPEQVALIGIDNDPLARMLTRIPMSSVIQGAQEMGRTAAHLLDQMLHGVRLADTRILVPPAGINVLASSKHEARQASARDARAPLHPPVRLPGHQDRTRWPSTWASRARRWSLLPPGAGLQRARRDPALQA
jgi:hypothetical protein